MIKQRKQWGRGGGGHLIASTFVNRLSSCLALSIQIDPNYFSEVLRLSTLVLADDKTRLRRASELRGWSRINSASITAARPGAREKADYIPGIKPQLMIALLKSQLWDVYCGAAAALVGVFCLRWRERL